MDEVHHDESSTPHRLCDEFESVQGSVYGGKGVPFVKIESIDKVCTPILFKDAARQFLRFTEGSIPRPYNTASSLHHLGLSVIVCD